MIAADEDVEPALRDHWEDVCAAFHDADAHHLYVTPDAITAGARRARGRCACRAISGAQPIEFRAQAADFAARSLNEAEPELEKLMRSGYRTRRHVAAARRGRARRLQPAAAAGAAGTSRTTGGLVFAEANLRDGFVAPPLKLAAIPEHRLIHRRGRAERPTRRGPRAAALVRRPAHRRHRRPRGPRARALRRLRHQDRRRRHPRLPRTSSSRAPTRSSCRSTSSRRSRATSAPAASTRRSPSSAARAGRR